MYINISAPKSAKKCVVVLTEAWSEVAGRSLKAVGWNNAPPFPSNSLVTQIAPLDLGVPGLWHHQTLFPVISHLLGVTGHAIWKEEDPAYIKPNSSLESCLMCLLFSPMASGHLPSEEVEGAGWSFLLSPLGVFLCWYVARGADPGRNVDGRPHLCLPSLETARSGQAHFLTSVWEIKRGMAPKSCHRKRRPCGSPALSSKTTGQAGSPEFPP